MQKRTKSDTSHAILDLESRQRKAAKIVKVLQRKTDLADARLLEIGTGSGYMARHFAGHAREVHSVDVVDERQDKSERSGYKFKLVKDEHLPYEPETFDIVTSNHVIEHVRDQKLHLDEVFRVLKDGGLVYLATPNRYWITDPHYKLPLINWMPRRAASWYLKTLRGKEWDIRPVTVNYVKRHSKKMRGNTEYLVAEIVKNPEQYNLDVFKKLHPLTKRLPRAVLKPASQLSPTILLIMTKKSVKK